MWYAGGPSTCTCLPVQWAERYQLALPEGGPIRCLDWIPGELLVSNTGLSVHLEARSFAEYWRQK